MLWDSAKVLVLENADTERGYRREHGYYKPELIVANLLSLKRPAEPPHPTGSLTSIHHRTPQGSTRRRTACYDSIMAESITQRELRNESGEIMRRLDQGESFVITRNGVPVGELTPLRRHRFVATAAVVAVFKNAPSIDPDRFRADVDSWAGQDVSPYA